MLTTVNVRKKRSGVDVLRKVSLEIPLGGVTGVIGPNGAGKSTLLDIITGFQHPDEGEVRLR